MDEPSLCTFQTYKPDSGAKADQTEDPFRISVRSEILNRSGRWLVEVANEEGQPLDARVQGFPLAFEVPALLFERFDLDDEPVLKRLAQLAFDIDGVLPTERQWFRSHARLIR